MNKSTYKILKRAGLDNIIDYDRLKKQRLHSNPSIRQKIDFTLNLVSFDDPDWGMDLNRFRKDFIKNSSPKNRLDEVVVTYLLFMSNLLSNEKISQTFIHHGAWDNEYAWVSMYKMIVYIIFTLCYDIKWESEYFFYMEHMIVDLMKGKSEALRTFAKRIGVKFSFDDDNQLYPAEIQFTKMDYHNSRVFGPYYWRMIHYIAESFPIRNNSKDAVLAKKLWKQFTTETLFRTLKCGICMHHYQSLIKNKYKQKILEETSDKDFPILWYTIHNEVNSNKYGNSGTTLTTNYAESEFKVDRKFMRSGLSGDDE